MIYSNPFVAGSTASFVVKIGYIIFSRSHVFSIPHLSKLCTAYPHIEQGFDVS